MKVLYDSSAVHQTIKEIFSVSKNPSARRIAVVAYLGVDAERFLPSPKGLRIICNPEPGATDPDSIRSLITKGAKIQFSDRLHSKVYWSEKGCIITSANISHRALGSGNQKETGILIDSKDFDIDRLIQYVEPYDISQNAMNILEISDRAIRRAARIYSNVRSQITYGSWFSSAYRTPWKLGWWTETGLKESKAAIEKSYREYSIRKPDDWLNVTKNQVKKGDWLLCFEITNHGLRKFKWMCVDFIVPVSSKEKNSYDEDYPFQAVQVQKSRFYTSPPFTITKDFRSAFKKAVQKYGIEKIEKSPSLKPRNTLLNYIAEYFPT